MDLEILQQELKEEYKSFLNDMNIIESKLKE